MTSLKEVMGNIEGRSNASAIHAKCLICDKPVTAATSVKPQTGSIAPGSPIVLSDNRNSINFNQLGNINNNNNNNNNSNVFNTPTFYGYDKSSDAEVFRPSSTSDARLGGSIARLNSGNMSERDRLRVSTEMSILRNSIDLPPITNVSYYLFCFYPSIHQPLGFCFVLLFKR